MATYKELQKRAAKRGLELSYTSGRNYDSGGYFKIYVLYNQGKEIANATSLVGIERTIAGYLPDAKPIRYGFKVNGKFRGYASKEAAENALQEAKDRHEMAKILVGDTPELSDDVKASMAREKAAWADWERRHPTKRI